MAVGNRRPITFAQHGPLKWTALLALLLPLTASLTAASQPQPQPPPAKPATTNVDPYNTSVSPTLSIFIVAFIGVFIIIIFFFIYLRCCVGGRSTVTPAAVTLSRREPQSRGLDSALLQTFPTMVYSDVKGHKSGKHSLECAVCLCEFEDDDILRFIPRCSHVFHRDCIDVWLDSHLTCPVCRTNLATNPLPPADHTAVVVDREMDLTDLVRIGSQRRLRSGSARRVPMGFVSRGSWEAVIAGGDGRFRLNLPEDVRKEILEAGRLRRSASLGVFSARGEWSSTRGYKEGRVWFRRSLRLGRSARWPILGRSFSAAGREEEAEGPILGYWKRGEMNGGSGGGGGSRVKRDDGDASTAACGQV